MTSLIAAAALGVGSAGCSSGEHDTTFHFLVDPPALGTAFTAWTEITLGVDITSVGVATLWGLSLTVEPPSTLPDLSFLTTLEGQAANGAVLTTVVTEDSFPVGQSTVDMNIVYDGDLHPLFETGTNTIRINWSGTTNGAYQGFPSGGVWMQGDVTINVQ